MNKKTLAGIGIVVGILLIGIIAITVFQFNTINESQKVSSNEIDLGRVSDGNYMGIYEEGNWKYLAKVKVRDHQIESVLSYKQQKADYEESLFDKIINALSLRKKGTSINKIAFSKAVQNALAQGIKK